MFVWKLTMWDAILQIFKGYSLQTLVNICFVTWVKLAFNFFLSLLLPCLSNVAKHPNELKKDTHNIILSNSCSIFIYLKKCYQPYSSRSYCSQSPHQHLTFLAMISQHEAENIILKFEVCSTKYSYLVSATLVTNQSLNVMVQQITLFFLCVLFKNGEESHAGALHWSKCIKVKHWFYKQKMWPDKWKNDGKQEVKI